MRLKAADEQNNVYFIALNNALDVIPNVFSFKRERKICKEVYGQSSNVWERYARRRWRLLVILCDINV